jgi:hypothetical protein
MRVDGHGLMTALFTAPRRDRSAASAPSQVLPPLGDARSRAGAAAIQRRDPDLPPEEPRQPGKPVVRQAPAPLDDEDLLP